MSKTKESSKYINKTIRKLAVIDTCSTLWREYLEDTFFFKHIENIYKYYYGVGNKIICSHVPHLHSQQMHCFLFHKKRSASPEMFHTSPPLLDTPTAVCAPTLLPATVNDLYTVFPKPTSPLSH